MEKTYFDVFTDTIRAAANLVKNRFIGFDGNYCAANAKAAGVSKLDVDSGQLASVISIGVALVETAGPITAGGEVVSDATGKALAATAFSVTVPSGATPVTSSGAQPDLTEAGSALPQKINGIALDTATGSGETIRVKVV